MQRPRMLDLFAGLGGASAAMVARGWSVTTVEIDETFPAYHRDVTTYSPPVGSFDLVWASPPCTEFSRESMPWCRTGNVPSVDLVREAMRVIDQAKPRFWVIENVRGSLKWLRPILGQPIAHLGPVWLWGVVPDGIVWPAHVAPYKQNLSSRRRAERSRIPVAISEALAKAVEDAL